MLAAYVSPARVRIKWPNDLLLLSVDGQETWAKVAGILLERIGDAVVVGFGVNLAHAPMLTDRATACIAETLGTAPEPNAFIETLAASVTRWLGRWRGEGFSVVRDRWLERAHPVGTPLAARTTDADEEGLFAGIDGSGTLTLQTATGTRLIAAGDVFLL